MEKKEIINKLIDLMKTGEDLLLLNEKASEKHKYISWKIQCLKYLELLGGDCINFKTRFESSYFGELFRNSNIQEILGFVDAVIGLNSNIEEIKDNKNDLFVSPELKHIQTLIISGKNTDALNKIEEFAKDKIEPKEFLSNNIKRFKNNPNTFNALMISASKGIIDMNEKLQATKSNADVLQFQNQLPEEIKKSVQKFKKDFPDQNKTAFIMMHFKESKKNRIVVKSIKDTLFRYGIIGLRADDKEYHADLFPNVMTYMNCCKFGIAIFDKLDKNEFNPNVSLEVGYMLALKKPICLIKNKVLKVLHADLIGKLYKMFSPRNIENTINKEVSRWLDDKGYKIESEVK